MGDSPPGEPFAVEVHERDGDRVVAVRGELDMTTMPQVQAAVEDVAAGTRLVLDFRRLGFMDSAGVHLLMRLDARARREGFELALVSAPGAVGRLIELCHLDQRITVLSALPGP